METYKRKFGDRKDARRIHEVTGMAQISIDLKPHRSVSDVYINQKMDVTNLCNYLSKRNNEGADITFFHAIMSAVGKVYYNRPKLNWFVANRHIYEHNDIVLSFVAKIEFADSSEEMMMLVPINPDDNVDSISNKISSEVNKIRNKEFSKEGANDAIDTLSKLPNVIRVPLVGAFKWLDQKGKLPRSLVKDNLYYSSLILSNLGSIKCGAIFHNINDFGTCSGLATIGEIKTEEVINADGQKEIRKLCEFGINLDERIADGYYFVKCIQLLQYLFNNPELLEGRSDEKIETPEIR